VCRFIKINDQWSPRHLLEVFFPFNEGSNHSKNENLPREILFTSPTAELDIIYTQILKHSIKEVREKKDKEKFSKDFKQVINFIIVLFKSLSFIALGKLLKAN
jgi:hypothetical protein